MRLALIIASIVLATVLGAVPGHADKRVALVIGNGAYKNVAALPNPASDARDIAASLTRLGFDVMPPLIDASFDQMRRALLDFGRRARGAEMAVVYFAGHGMEVGGENWLIPTDAELRSDTDAENEAVSLRSVILQVSGATRLGMVILDACRNNPFAAKMQRTTSRVRAVERGFVRVEPSDNVLVAYAARDGTTASDGDGRNSPFTAALLKHLDEPGLEIRFLFATVRDDVMAATKREQQPFIYQSLPAQQIYLRAPGQVAVVVPPVAPVVPWSDPCTGAVPISFASRCAAPLTAAQERGLKPKDSFKECDKCPEMVVVPAGSFTMGSPNSRKGCDDGEGPQHQVTFARTFAVGRFAVSFDEWDACVADGGCGGYRPADQGWGRGRRPVINVSLNDAKAYLAWLSRKTGKEYQLLSEAEREYVTRAGTSTSFWWGSSITTNQANYEGYSYGGSKGVSRQKTEPVDSFQPNPWGLYQVHGNVWEWTEDCYHDNYNGAPTNGSAWTTGDCGLRALRGGSWNAPPGDLRADHRYGDIPAIRNGNIGFRIGRTLSPKPA
jgi:formylglycine-generating enzyme required for sulfatase activity